MKGTRAEKIVRKLTPGQRTAILRLPILRDFRPDLCGFQWNTICALKAQALVRSRKEYIAGSPPDAPHLVSDLGKEVRAILEAKVPK